MSSGNLRMRLFIFVPNVGTYQGWSLITDISTLPHQSGTQVSLKLSLFFAVVDVGLTFHGIYNFKLDCLITTQYDAAGVCQFFE